MLPQYTASDKDVEDFLKKRIAVIGYGSQGSAQALNLRDSGADVIIGNRPGKSFDRAESDGFTVCSVRDAVTSADVIAVMLPDEAAGEIYSTDIAPYLRAHQTLLFATDLIFTTNLLPLLWMSMWSWLPRKAWGRW